MIYFSAKKGLTIFLTQTKYIRNEFDQINVVPGKRVQFSNGKYYTKDEEEIRLLNEFMKTKNDIVRAVDDEYQMIEEDYIKEAKEKAKMAYTESRNKALEDAKKKIKEKVSNDIQGTIQRG